jgi:hypothetical protein
MSLGNEPDGHDSIQGKPHPSNNIRHMPIVQYRLSCRASQGHFPVAQTR